MIKGKYMTKNTTIRMAVLALLIVGCGKKADPQQADANSINNVNAYLSKTGIDTSTCDGEGTELSGVYEFKFTNVKSQCSAIQSLIKEAGIKYKCTQKDKDFSCVNTNTPSDVLSGCITKDAKFKLALGKPEVAAQTTIVLKGFLSGTLNKEDGKVLYSMANPHVSNKACVTTSDLDVQTIN
jgi:hypothetical protein